MRILLIDIDSLRPDHLACYGYHRPTSPNIDSIAEQGVRFDNYYATDTPCLPSRTALYSGQFGIRTGVVNHGGEYADPAVQGIGRGFRAEAAINSFANTLRQAGLHTASISPFPARHTAYQIWYGFSEMHDTGKNGLDNADEVYPYAKRWLEANGQSDNWFLHVNFWDPHTPYDHPASFARPFAGEPIDEWITQDLLNRQNESFGLHGAAEVAGATDQLPPAATMGAGRIRTLEDARKHMDGYDAGIRFADHYVGLILDDLKALGIFDDVAIIVTADHGENQGELNVWGDHQTADQFTNRIPLIVRWPGVTDGQAGAHHDGLLYHIDLAPTVAELAGGRAPATWNGESFAATLRGEEDAGRDFLVLSNGAWSCQRSVRWDNWLLIRTYQTGLKEYPAYMLFDLEADPHETHNLAAERQDVLGQGLLRLDEWMGEQMGRSQRGDPFWGVMAEGGPLHANERSVEWKQYVQRLRETGRGRHADNLDRFGGRPFTTGLEPGKEQS